MLPVWFCGFIVLETAESGELFASVLFLWVFFLLLLSYLRIKINLCSSSRNVEHMMNFKGFFGTACRLSVILEIILW